MAKKLTNNWLLKLASLLFSFTLWLVVINIEDPTSSQTFSSVPVKFTNTETLTKQGLVYDVLENTGTVKNVTVYGPRSVVEQLKSEDIVAVADFNSLTEENTIPVEFYTNRFSDKITKIKGNVSNVKLSVEEEKTVRLLLKVSAVGEVAEGYVLGNMTPDQNQIIVTGGQSVIDQISKAIAEVDVTDATANIATYSDVILLNSEGEPIDTSKVTMKAGAVRISVEVLSTKRVPLSFDVSGTPADGYMATGIIESSPSMVTIAGPSGKLNQISRIEVPAEELNVTGQSTNMTATLPIRNFLPDGIVLAEEDANLKASVTVYISETSTKIAFLDAANVTPSKEIEGFDIKFENLNDRTTLHLSGLKDTIAEITSDSISAVVDMDALMKENSLSEWKAGKYDAELTIILPNEAKVEEVVPVRVILEKSKE